MYTMHELLLTLPEHQFGLPWQDP